jgi:hypothetical protein
MGISSQPYSFPRKGVYDPKAFIPHAVSLDRAFAHCPRFLTAASRRSLGRISVPMWLVVLSDQLPITALVGHYPTNKLIGRSPIPLRRQDRLWYEVINPVQHRVLAILSDGCPRQEGRLATCYSPVRRSVTDLQTPKGNPFGPIARLACVKRTASVHPELGSNSLS